MKRQLPLIIIFVCGIFMVFQYFIPHENSEFIYEFAALDWPPIIGVFALTLGIISLVRVSAAKISKRDEDWQYSIVTLIGLAMMIIAGLPWFGGQTSPAVKWQFDFIMRPIIATIFSLLSFFIASAAYRAFRARSVLASILLISAVIVMIRFMPLGPFTDIVSRTADWVLNVPNLAAKRAIIIGVGLGIISTALKVVLGVERSYLGRD
ncbi:MAG: hypothetical protein HZB43_08480 [candidate division Zixibacteria bacterium]|nr:hypothetical protein [candidate division Zixibacteria bacterium]